MADVELLPLPEDYDQNPAGNAEIQDYARANVAHATAARDAEIEALRAELEDYRAAAIAEADEVDRRGKRMEALRAEVRQAQALSRDERHKQLKSKLRAERLTEALRNAREYAVIELDRQREASKGHEHCSEIASIEGDLADIDELLSDQHDQEE